MISFPTTGYLFKDGPVMSHKLQLAREVTVLPRDNNADNILFASWPLFIIVYKLRLKLKVRPG